MVVTVPLAAAGIYAQADGTLDIVFPLYGPGRLPQEPHALQVGSFDLRYVPVIPAAGPLPEGDVEFLGKPPVLRIQISGVGPAAVDKTLAVWDPDAEARAVMRANNERSLNFAGAPIWVAPADVAGKPYDAVSVRVPIPPDMHADWKTPAIGATLDVTWE